MKRLLFIPNKIRDLHLPDGSDDPLVLATMAFHDFFAGTQTPRLDYQFPKGVALKLPAQAGIDLNTHYVNRTGEPSTGEVYMNLHTIEKSDVKHEAKIINFNNADIDLPPNRVTTVTADFSGQVRDDILPLII